MLAARAAPAFLLLLSSLPCRAFQGSTAPWYTAASIVNAASNLPNNYAPNTIVSLYGLRLSDGVRGLPANTSVLPTSLNGVSVLLGILPANLYYVSPDQINILVPSNLLPGPVTVSVTRQGSAGPPTTIVLNETAPQLFAQSPGTVLATHANGSLITEAAPASVGEVIVVYALGLGRTIPDVVAGQVTSGLTKLQHLADMEVVLSGTPLDPKLIYYAGLTPGFAGLYQINMQVPAGAPPNPELRVAIGTQISVPGLALRTH